MKDLIKNRIPLQVDLAPDRDVVYSGIALKSNDEVFIFICYNEEAKEFDGFAIIRSYEINKYRVWDEDELSEIKNNNYSDFLEILPLERMNTMFQCLSELKDNELLAIFIESDDSSYFVGKIGKLTKNEVELRLLDEEANWKGIQKLKIDQITYIGFGTSYEKDLQKKTTLQQNL